MFTPRQLPLAQVSEHILHSSHLLHGNCFIPNPKIQDIPPPVYAPSCIKTTETERTANFSLSIAFGLEVLGHEMKGLIKGAKNLRQLGIEELGLPLPKLIVVGDQSTGKSSLIEGIRLVIGFPSYQ